MATVEIVVGRKKQHQPKTIPHKHFAPEKNYETIMGGQEQGMHCRLCLVFDHNMDQCGLTSTELAEIGVVNFQSLYGARRRNLGERGRRLDNHERNIRQGAVGSAGPLRK